MINNANALAPSVMFHQVIMYVDQSQGYIVYGEIIIFGGKEGTRCDYIF